jgi:pimeloyl-ACP methyl ester carboxylesterase
MVASVCFAAAVPARSRAVELLSGVVEEYRDVLAGEIRLRITEWASPSASSEAVVALPGALAPRGSFAELGKRLAADFRFVAVDLPGFGESEKPPPGRFDYSPASIAESITYLMSALGVGRAHVLGHGLGGAIAIHLGARRPELVRSLALICPLGPPEGVPDLARFALAPVVGDLIFRQLLTEGLFARLYRGRVQKSAEPSTIASYFEALQSPASRLALLALLRSSIDTRPIIADCRRIRSPSLVLWGRDDKLFGLKTGRLLAREIQGTGFEILDTGHAPHEEDPERTARTLALFFKGERAGAPLSRASRPR